MYRFQKNADDTQLHATSLNSVSEVLASGSRRKFSAFKIAHLAEASNDLFL
jgi:hypothetical protein